MFMYNNILDAYAFIDIVLPHGLNSETPSNRIVLIFFLDRLTRSMLKPSIVLRIYL